MKNILRMFLSLIILMSAAKAQQKDEVENYELKKDEILLFPSAENRKITYSAGNMSSHSYDQKQYNISYDQGRNITLKKRIASPLPRPCELDFYLCEGSFKGLEGGVQITATSTSKFFYLIKIEEGGVIDSFDNEVTIILKAQTVKKEACPILITSGEGGNVNCFAMPRKADPKSIYHHVHKPNEIGYFTTFEVFDKSGKRRKFSPGSYILIAGNSLIETKK